ncbi:MAG: sulfide/dihydroorotate dehydrogenase-like FAD/NAD-binding protein [Nitrospinota bacterium]|nr:sulfide/dihydroorotate dehydrogenase-like FAD/NAD-binding protein [Nitrospinota bacterium]MDH5677242.1 sulfide/dihydroorotate dehydrogenase-like FAD/NAD-binding protein [Nitrospinota bacterium]MDH5756387.1 sulfide/dihydroorotate dehydrogenase-like FAD/NAD-binding protein [Nitrospinota bacterium]
MTSIAKETVKKFASREIGQLQATLEEIKGLSGLTAEQKKEIASGIIPLFYRDHSEDDDLDNLIRNAEKTLALLGDDVVDVVISHMVEADMESVDHFARALGDIGAPAVEPVLKALTNHSADGYVLTSLLQAMSYFKDESALKTMRKAFEYTGHANPQVRSAALHCLGRVSNNLDLASASAEDRSKMFDAVFSSLSAPKAITRLHAVRALGEMLRNSYLTAEQVDKTHKALRAILGFDDFEWDVAYIVRAEADRFLHLCREPAAAGAQSNGTGRYKQEFTIIEKRELVPMTHYMRVNAPLIAKKIQAGQFIIIRPNAHSERIPLSICGWNREEGYIEIIVMGCGRTSMETIAKNVGDKLQDVVGPLGQRSHIRKHEGACVVLGGGYGTGAIIPTARDLKALGNKVYGVVGARTKDLLIMVDELREVCDEVFVTTNDGSEGIEGFVTHALDKIMKREPVSYTLAVGPVPMMMAVTKMNEGTDIEGWVSLNAIMVDGTGMCGACRVSVGAKTKFACFHGPDFLGKDVDFTELTKRQKMFVDKEKIAMEAYGK